MSSAHRDADGVRDDRRGHLVDHLSDPEGVPVGDTPDLKRVRTPDQGQK